MHIKGVLSTMSCQSNFGIEQILLLHLEKLSSDLLNFRIRKKKHKKTAKMPDNRWHAYYKCRNCNTRYEAIIRVYDSTANCSICFTSNYPYQQVTRLLLDSIRSFNIFQFLGFLCFIIFCQQLYFRNGETVPNA